ncbi:MAG: 30S ribosomal protein S27e [Nanoarchaeota archaeon]
MMKGKFIKIVCPRCKKNQIIFGKASTNVKCKSCNTLLVRTTGGKAKIRAAIKEVLP